MSRLELPPDGRHTGAMRDRRRRPQPIPSRPSPRAAAIGALALSGAIALAGCGDGGDHEAAAPASTAAQAATVAIVHRTPSCGCCKSYEDYLRKHGYEVESVVAEDLDPVKAEYGIPDDTESCHTSIIGGYAVEGHVPVEAIEALLAERPDVEAIAVPGMPTNSPGMGEPNGEPLEVVAVGTDGQLRPFMTL